MEGVSAHASRRDLVPRAGTSPTRYHPVPAAIGAIDGGDDGDSGPCRETGFLVHEVYQVARRHGVPIIGQGGIASAEDAVEFLIAGASAVGIGTALFYDPLVCGKINRGLCEYLRRHDLDRVSRLTGTLAFHPDAEARCA